MVFKTLSVIPVDLTSTQKAFSALMLNYAVAANMFGKEQKE
jgi:hypothetical protein